MMERYSGPVIDAHTHLWDLTMGRHPWLMPSGAFGPKGRLDALKGKNYMLDDYRSDIAGTDVVASVHIEALWDSADTPVNETRWLATLDGGPLASRYVAGVTFGVENTVQVLRAQAEHDQVRGVRQVIAWTPNPERRMADRAGIAREEGWRSAIPHLLELDLHLELLLYPYQGDDVASLAASFPDLSIVVNHVGSPIEQDEEGLRRWRQAIMTMAAHPNVQIKLSAAAAYPDEKSIAAMRTSVEPILQEFGAGRVLWGSDFPVGSLVGWTYADYLSAYRAILDEGTATEQAAILHDNANALYRFER